MVQYISYAHCTPIIQYEFIRMFFVITRLKCHNMSPQNTPGDKRYKGKTLEDIHLTTTQEYSKTKITRGYCLGIFLSHIMKTPCCAGGSSPIHINPFITKPFSCYLVFQGRGLITSNSYEPVKFELPIHLKCLICSTMEILLSLLRKVRVSK